MGLSLSELYTHRRLEEKVELSLLHQNNNKSQPITQWVISKFDTQAHGSQLVKIWYLNSNQGAFTKDRCGVSMLTSTTLMVKLSSVFTGMENQQGHTTIKRTSTSKC